MVRDRIRVTRSPPPPADLAWWLGELRRLAEAGDRGGILAALRALVPTYETPRAVARVAAPPALPAVQRAAASTVGAQ